MNAAATTIVVMAKECIPGKVKTRLHPPLSFEDAARVASASLTDTLDAVAATGLPVTVCAQGIIAVPAGFASIPQVSGGLDERIAAAVDTCGGRVLLIGMDTPQVDPRLLRALADDWPDHVDAWFGPATDGGFWLLGLGHVSSDRLGGRTRGDLVRGVPMSSPETGLRQRERLIEAGLCVQDVGPLTDIDDIDSLREVAAVLPQTGTLAQLLPRLDLPPALASALAAEPREGSRS